MEKNKNLVIIPPCNTYGDTMSIIALIYFLQNYYENIILCIIPQEKVITYFNYFFEKDPLYNKNLFVLEINKINTLINDNEYDTYHICNTHTGDWQHNIENYIFFKNGKIKKDHYFCDSNPLYNFLEINENYLCKPNIKLPLQNIEINSIVYYKMIGLNNNVRMIFFNYHRNLEKEKYYTNNILQKFNIKDGEKYNIINSFNEYDNNKIQSKITNNYTSIDINFLLPDFSGWLFELVENAAEIHLVEGLNTNFIYYCQYKKIINIDEKPVYFHIWARNRNWIDYNLDYSWKMMDNPKLSNWNYVLN